MKKLFLLLAGALAVLQAAMAMSVCGQYYCVPGQTEFSGPDTSETYLSPWSANVYSGNDPVEVVAKPAVGWAVDSWYVAETYSSSFAGERIDGADGALSVFRPYRAGAGGKNIVEYLGVKFRWLTYSLAYDSNGGSSVPGQNGLFYTNKFALAAAPVRAGYDFEGWKDSADQVFAANEEVTGSDFSELDDVHQDDHQVKLTAQWNEQSYAVGAAGENCTVTVASSAKFTDALQISWQPEQANFTRPTVVVHAGADATGAVLATYSSGTSATFTMSSSGAYYDQIFITVRYKVRTLTFDPNGGECAEVSRRVEKGATLAPPALPTPMQYRKEFDGWFMDDGAQVGSTTTYDWEIDVTVKAKWRDAELMTIETEVIPGGAGTVSGAGDYLSGETAHLNVTETADGYSFSHWTNAFSQAGWATPTLEVKVDGNAKYAAVFTGNVYTVTFYTSEGEPEEQVQGFTFGKPYGSLPTVTREGDWTFDGWFTKPKGNGERITEDTVFAETDNELWLYANWKVIPTYMIRYNGNGASSGEMPDQKAYCGEDTTLTPNQFVRGGYYFLNWTNASGTVYADGATVKDLAAEGETAVLYAVWKEMTLAEAMHCDNLDWTSEIFAKMTDGKPWRVGVGDNVGSNSNSCVWQESTNGVTQALTAKLGGAGTLTFWWKPTGGNGMLLIWCDNLLSPDIPQIDSVSGTDGVWSSYELNVTQGESLYVHIVNRDFNAFTSFDRMTWTPKGTHPEPEDGVDNVEIKTAAIVDGKFTLSFESDEKFDYNLLTNANLQIEDGWGVMETLQGDGSFLKFEPAIIEGHPQMFYRVDTIQRKD